MLYKLKKQDDKTTFIPVKATTMAELGYVEKVMENWLAENPHAVLPDEEARFLVICQETPFENLTDILAVDERGNVIVIEIKRGQTPRDVIAQALEYVSDVAGWDYHGLNHRATAYFAQRHLDYASLLEAIQQTFEIEPGELSEAQINQRQRVFIVGEDIEPKILRTAQWLQQRGVEIGCVSYTCYQTQDHELFLDFSTVGPIDHAPIPLQPSPTGTSNDQGFYPFWEQLLDRARVQGVTYLSTKSPSVDRWLYSSAGIPNYRFIFQIRASGTPEIQFEIRGPDAAANKVLFDRLHHDKNLIEERCGSPLEWDRRDLKLASYVRWALHSELNLDNRSGWDTVQDAMLSALTRLVGAVEPYLSGLSA